jgi:hypothetical protein
MQFNNPQAHAFFAPKCSRWLGQELVLAFHFLSFSIFSYYPFSWKLVLDFQ